MKGTVVVTNIGELATPQGTNAAAGRAMSSIYKVGAAALVAENGRITYCGPQTSAPFLAAARAARRLDPSADFDARGQSCVPAFVDSHTHFIFAGDRSDEFFWRMGGLPYMEIHHRGGGIRRTMEATRAARLEELVATGFKRLQRMLAQGIGTVEGKSGYGLDIETEEKQLRAMAELSTQQPLRIVPTYMGAHSLPPEFEGRTSEYIDFLIFEGLPRVAALNLATFADIFCEKGVFSIEDSRRYLKAAQNHGLGLKIHADEIERTGGAVLSAELGAISADHLLKASPEDYAAMAEAGVIATCLPLTAFALKEPFADARSMIDAGLAVALASDFNPGSSYSQSIPLIFALAVVSMSLSFAETLTSLTLNGAAALGLAESKGSLESGKDADFLILDAPKTDHLAYHFGMNIVSKVFLGGDLAYSAH